MRRDVAAVLGEQGLDAWLRKARFYSLQYGGAQLCDEDVPLIDELVLHDGASGGAQLTLCAPVHDDELVYGETDFTDERVLLMLQDDGDCELVEGRILALFDRDGDSGKRIWSARWTGKWADSDLEPEEIQKARAWYARNKRPRTK